MKDILAELRARGCVENVSSEELGPRLAAGMVSFYVGFDPTAPSLQLGNLFGIMNMARLQRAGHRPIAVVGGATGMIGDPSGKAKERQLLSVEAIDANLAGQRLELERLLDFESGATSCVLVNNFDWLGKFAFIDFLRDVGKRFRMGEMLAKESVRRRLDTDEGMSFTEFTYQLLQAYDFLHVHQSYGCQLQCGGSDQWGNITAGIELVRRVTGSTVHGLVWPLVTDSQGRKFGKSEGTALYLNPAMTSPYELYQYLVNTEDSTVVRYLRFFTFLEMAAIDELAARNASAPEKREAQRRLAAEVVAIVHGRAAAQAAEQASQVLFGGRIEKLSDRELLAIFADVPASGVDRGRLTRGVPLVDLLVETGLCKSKGEARRLLGQAGAYLNNVVIEEAGRLVTAADLAGESILVLRTGKKRYHLVRAV